MKKLWVRKGGSFEEETEADREFWEQMTGAERLEALEELQREVWGLDEASERLRRVARVVEREGG
jgi:hypothetical protein